MPTVGGPVRTTVKGQTVDARWALLKNGMNPYLPANGTECLAERARAEVGYAKNHIATSQEQIFYLPLELSHL